MHSLRDITEPVDLRQLYGRYPTGVTTVCAMSDGRPVGLTASSFVAVSLHPPLVSVCIQHGSWSWRQIRNQTRLGISFLGDQQSDTALALASRASDRFEGLDYQTTAEGAVLFSQAAAWLECTLERQIAAGDHDLVLMRVHRASIAEYARPLIFHASRFHGLARC